MCVYDGGVGLYIVIYLPACLPVYRYRIPGRRAVSSFRTRYTSSLGRKLLLPRRAVMRRVLHARVSRSPAEHTHTHTHTHSSKQYIIYVYLPTVRSVVILHIIII